MRHWKIGTVTLSVQRGRIVAFATKWLHCRNKQFRSKSQRFGPFILDHSFVYIGVKRIKRSGKMGRIIGLPAVAYVDLSHFSHHQNSCIRIEPGPGHIHHANAVRFRFLVYPRAAGYAHSLMALCTPCLPSQWPYPMTRFRSAFKMPATDILS